VLLGERAARTVRSLEAVVVPKSGLSSFFPVARPAFGRSLSFLTGILFVVATASHAQSPSAAREIPDAPFASLPDSRETAEIAAPENPRFGLKDDAEPQASAQQSTPPATAPQPDQPGASKVDPNLKTQSEVGAEQLKKQEQQRILGVMPAFNSVFEGTVPPMTPKQKFQLMFKSTTDAYVFGFAAFTAGIGQAQDSHAAYGQGVEGYAKRFGANYVDTADGNFWGNAVLPIILHQDPRYFRLGHGTFKHRLLYSMSTSVICKSDSGKWEPNYSNVLGNLISGGISNVYYPAQDRGAAQTFQSAATVTAEGMIGAALLEFWPDIANHYHLKRQAKRDAAAAAARSAQAANPSGLPPQ